jgi:hypothetical protein
LIYFRLGVKQTSRNGCHKKPDLYWDQLPSVLINTGPRENGKTRKTKFISLLYLQNNYSKQNIVPIKYK